MLALAPWHSNSNCCVCLHLCNFHIQLTQTFEMSHADLKEWQLSWAAAITAFTTVSQRSALCWSLLLHHYYTCHKPIIMYYYECIIIMISLLHIMQYHYDVIMTYYYFNNRDYYNSIITTHNFKFIQHHRNSDVLTEKSTLKSLGSHIFMYWKPLMLLDSDIKLQPIMHRTAMETVTTDICVCVFSRFVQKYKPSISAG